MNLEPTCKKHLGCPYATEDRCNKNCPAYQKETDKDILSVIYSTQKKRIYDEMAEDHQIRKKKEK